MQVCLPIALQHGLEELWGQFFENCQVPLNGPNNRNFGAFGGSWPELHTPSSHYVGPHGCERTHFTTK